MSILINGMSLPKDGCKSCAFCICGVCLIRANLDKPWGVARGCPLVELPPHGRLGDLDKLDYAFTALRFNGDGSLNHWDDRKNWCLHGSEIEMLLANAPTIIPAEGGVEG